jgi:heavy metal sensor kinase
MRRLSIRWHLTLWYGGLFAVSLAIFSLVVYASFARDLLAEVDRALDVELAEMAQEIERASDLTVLQAQLHKNFGEIEVYELQVIAADGRQIFATPLIQNQTFPIPPDLGSETSRQNARVVGNDLPPHRVSSRRASGPAGQFVMQAAEPLKVYRRNLAKLLLVLIGLVPAVLGVAMAGGYFLARRALAPVDRLTKAAAEITAARLDRRVDADHPDDELGRLARTFNEMIAGLQKSFEEMRRFTADAAHELRTPLAVLKNEAEVALRQPRSSETYCRALQDQLLEIDRMTRLADQLLLLCREDSGLQPVVNVRVRLDLLISDLCEQLQVVADARGVSLQFRGLSPAIITGDADRLRRLFFNLLDNALKYTPPPGEVAVWGRMTGERIEIVIEDSGIGIAAEHLPHLFDRFYRVDPARSRTTEGTGLGLAICRSIAEAYRGEISIDSEPGRGTRVTVFLPRVLSMTPDVATQHENVTPPQASPYLLGNAPSNL